MQLLLKLIVHDCLVIKTYIFSVFVNKYFMQKKKKVQPKQNHKEKEIINYCADGAGEL